MSGNHNMYCGANSAANETDNMFLTLEDYIASVNKRFADYDKIRTSAKEVDCQGDDKYKLEEYCTVTKPKHYMLFPEYDIEVRDLMILLANQMDFEGYSGILISDYVQAMQYLLRWHNKNGVEDIKKAQFYLNKIVEVLDEAA